RELAASRELDALRAQLGEAAQLSFAAVGRFEKKEIRTWDFGDLPETLSIERNGVRLIGYPALMDDGDSVSLALLDTREAADASTRAGVVRLMRLQLKDALSRFEKPPPEFVHAALQLKAAIPS